MMSKLMLYDVFMRTTLTLDEDVAQFAKALAKKSDRPFKEVINQALRFGLIQIGRAGATKPYQTVPRQMGLKEGLSIDNIQELLSRLEGEEAR